MATAYAAGTTSMVPSAAALLRHRLAATTSYCSSLPYLPPRLTSSIKLRSDTKKFTLHKIRAASSEDTSGSLEVGEIVSDLKEKWDALEDKSTVLLYGGGTIVAVWLFSIVVGAINSVPLLPKIFELVGLGYTGWFVYHYLLFKSSRKELATNIEALKKKIAGTE